MSRRKDHFAAVIHASRGEIVGGQRLEGKVALVTGGDGELGHRVAVAPAASSRGAGSQASEAGSPVLGSADDSCRGCDRACRLGARGCADRGRGAGADAGSPAESGGLTGPLGEVALISAPSNLGLRPPQAGAVPGAAKAPEALREAGFHARFGALGAREAGVILPGRYLDDVDGTGARLRNHGAIVDHARRLATRIDQVLEDGAAPLLLGGDCSVLVGAGLALRQRGRFGLIYIDGHTDFRHPGNTPVCESLAGEDLAAAIGLHWPSIADLDGYGPYFHAADTVHVGCRFDDEHIAEVRGTLARVIPAPDLEERGAAAVSREILSVVAKNGIDGYWLHLDVDVLDPAVLPAVDSPAPGGLQRNALVTLLAGLAPQATGAQITIFDPDLDPDGRYAAELSEILLSGLARLGEARRR